MSGNDAVLVGKKEIAFFLRVSERKVDEWRKRYPEMPVFTEGRGSMLYANKEKLSGWQQQLFAGLANGEVEVRRR